MKIKPSVILLVLVLGYFAYNIANRIWLEDMRAERRAQELGQGDNPAARGRAAIPVDYMIVTYEMLEDMVVATGTLVAGEQVDLRPEGSGRITQINFTEGARVRAGQLLVKINDRELQAQYERARHRQRLAEDRHRRSNILLEREAISLEEYEIVLTELNSLRAETDLIRAQIERTEIRAPFDGTVGLRSVSVGEFITSQNIVARIVNNDPIRLDFSVPERFFDVVRINSNVQFRVSGSDTLYTARVFAIEPHIDLDTRTILMRAIAPNPDGRLFPGASARVHLAMTPTENAIMVPAESLLSEAEGHKGFVYKNGRAEQRDLVIGTRTARQTQIISGLQVGDTLIVSGIMQLRPNVAVRLNPQAD